MTVAELMEFLAKLPPEAKLRVHYDGAARDAVTSVWLTNGGWVSVGSRYEPIYNMEDAMIGGSKGERFHGKGD